MSEPSCLTADRLVLYLEDRLESPERTFTEEHLSECLACRDRLAGTFTSEEDEAVSLRAPESLKQAARAIPRRSAAAAGSPWYGALAAVLLAALGLTFYARFAGDRQSGEAPDDTLRHGGSAVLLALAPDAGAHLAAEVIQFRWTAVPEVRLYTLTVVDGTGNIVFRGDTSQDGLALDLAASGLAFERGQSYYWYVTALLEDGTRLESEIRPWTLARPPP